MNGLGAAWKGRETMAIPMVGGATAQRQPISNASLTAAAWQYSPVPMRIADDSGTVLAVNAAYCQMVEKRREELEGEHFSKVYAGSVDAESFVNDFVPLSRTGKQIVHGGCTFPLSTGKMLRVDLSHSLFVEEGGRVAVLSHFQLNQDLNETWTNQRPRESGMDISQSGKLLKDLAVQKERINDLLAHDLRSPLGSIVGFCEILANQADELSPEEHEQFVCYIKEAATNQLRMVDTLVYWSRLESGKIPVKKERHDLAALVQECLDRYREQAERYNVSLFSVLPSNMTVEGDKDLLLRMLEELVGNALKFTPPEGSVSIYPLPGEIRDLQIEIRDNGIGIAVPEATPLFKIGGVVARRGLHGEGGVGFGLPIVGEIIRMHGGSITVESEVGKGTGIVVSLPNPTGRQGLN